VVEFAIPHNGVPEATMEGYIAVPANRTNA
jgi:hypothetical protein